MSEAFIPEEAETTTETATAATGEKEYAPIADGYYWCRPVKVTDAKKDGTPLDEVNIVIRVWFKAIETAPLGGDPMPVAENVELANNTITLVYGLGGRIYDTNKKVWRLATDADTEEAIAKMARIFPEWAAFETDDPSEKLAWFMTHFEDFAKCKCLCKISHSSHDGVNYTNATLVERKKVEANIGAIKSKLTRGNKAVLAKFLVKPGTAKNAGSAPTAAPAPAAEMPPEAPSDEGGGLESTKAECWQYFCENHPDKGKTMGAWLNMIAEVKAARGKASEAQFTAADWGVLMNKLCDMWPNF